jgi:energy-converting hydrogenase A subunit M
MNREHTENTHSEKTKGSVAIHTARHEMYSFVSNKVEKLSTAVYMVTSYMDDNEPIKKSLKVVALSSVANAAELLSRENSAARTNLTRDLEHALSLVNLSEMVQIMSHMNAELLRSEYTKLLTLVKDGSDFDTQHVQEALSHQNDEMFLSGHVATREMHQRQNHVLMPREVYTDQTVAIETNETDGAKSSEVKKTETVARAEETEPQARESFAELKTVSEKTLPTFLKLPRENKETNNNRKDGRREAIIASLRRDTALSIKDVAKKVKGCSEKTIQRELNSLVEKKQARRIGEKRWSRYILV